MRPTLSRRINPKYGKHRIASGCCFNEADAFASDQPEIRIRAERRLGASMRPTLSRRINQARRERAATRPHASMRPTLSRRINTQGSGVFLVSPLASMRPTLSRRINQVGENVRYVDLLASMRPTLSRRINCADGIHFRGQRCRFNEADAFASDQPDRSSPMYTGAIRLQ